MHRPGQTCPLRSPCKRDTCVTHTYCRKKGPFSSHSSHSRTLGLFFCLSWSQMKTIWTQEESEASKKGCQRENVPIFVPIDLHLSHGQRPNREARIALGGIAEIFWGGGVYVKFSLLLKGLRIWTHLCSNEATTKNGGRIIRSPPLPNSLCASVVNHLLLPTLTFLEAIDQFYLITIICFLFFI